MRCLGAAREPSALALPHLVAERAAHAPEAAPVGHGRELHDRQLLSRTGGLRRQCSPARAAGGTASGVADRSAERRLVHADGPDTVGLHDLPGRQPRPLRAARDARDPGVPHADPGDGQRGWLPGRSDTAVVLRRHDLSDRDRRDRDERGRKPPDAAVRTAASAAPVELAAADPAALVGSGGARQPQWRAQPVEQARSWLCGELPGADLQKVHELSGGVEGIGDHGTVREGQCGEQATVDLGHECGEGQLLRAIELRENRQRGCGRRRGRSG